MPLKLLTAEGDVIRPTLENSDPLQGFISEIVEVIESIDSVDRIDRIG